MTENRFQVWATFEAANVLVPEMVRRVSAVRQFSADQLNAVRRLTRTALQDLEAGLIEALLKFPLTAFRRVNLALHMAADQDRDHVFSVTDGFDTRQARDVHYVLWFFETRRDRLSDAFSAMTRLRAMTETPDAVRGSKLLLDPRIQRLARTR
jgi:hypothetical protein